MYAYPIVSRLVHPYAPLVILLGLAIAWLWWKGKLSRAQLIVLTVPYILLEDRSGSTYENAVESAKILKGRGFEQVLLVTDAASLLRAEMCFQRQGIDVIPSGCCYRTVGGFRFSAVAFLPSVDAADDMSEAWHEWLGLIWYWLRDRI